MSPFGLKVNDRVKVYGLDPLRKVGNYVHNGKAVATDHEQGVPMLDGHRPACLVGNSDRKTTETRQRDRVLIIDDVGLAAAAAHETAHAEDQQEPCKRGEL